MLVTWASVWEQSWRSWRIVRFLNKLRAWTKIRILFENVLQIFKVKCSRSCYLHWCIQVLLRNTNLYLLPRVDLSIIKRFLELFFYKSVLFYCVQMYCRAYNIKYLYEFTPTHEFFLLRNFKNTCFLVRHQWDLSTYNRVINHQIKPELRCLNSELQVCTLHLYLWMPLPASSILKLHPARLGRSD